MVLLVDLLMDGSGSGSSLRRQALGTSAPEVDLGLVDLESAVLGHVQAGRFADGTVDVCDETTRAADDVVVVVPHPRLVASHRAGGLEAPDEASGGQRAQHVVDGLMGDVREVPTHGADDRVRVGVRLRLHRSEYGDPRSGHPEGSLAQHLLDLGRGDHGRSLALFLETVKNRRIALGSN
jgi:hypothetical protein